VLADLLPATRQFIDVYLLMIRANSSDFKMTAKMSGLLVQHVFQELNQNNSQQAVNTIILLLGELITIADALLDVKKDSQNNQYNPVITATEQNNTTLEQEYTHLKTGYDQLVQDINTLVDSQNLNTVNPLFCDILQQSLRNLTGKINRENKVLFANQVNNQRNNRRNNSRTNHWCECIDNVCDCFGCCENNCCCECGCGDCCGGCSCDC
jgi:hypothetical protein